MDQKSAIIDLCRELGIDEYGLGSIKNFISAAFYHVRLPGTLPADEHLAYNTAIRHATNRIACQGRHGNSRGMSRLLSRGAVDLRDAILKDLAIESPSGKVRRWLGQVTKEHQDPALAVEAWIRVSPNTRTVDDVVRRLLTYPPVIMTREEEKRIPGRFRHGGTPTERYGAAQIEWLFMDEGTFAFFRSRLSPNRQAKPGKYHKERKPL